MVGRRAWLTAAAGGVAIALGNGLRARERQTFFASIDCPIALQTYTLGETVGKDIAASFARIAAIGYREVELPGLYGLAPSTIRRAADDAGVKVSGVHLGALPAADGAITIHSETSAIVEALGALGASRAAMPTMLIPAGLKIDPAQEVGPQIARAVAAAGEDLWMRTADILNRTAAALAPSGLSFAYHNHNVEFAPLGTRRGWDVLIEECDPALVQFEIDTGWVAAAGLDPADLLSGIVGRVAQLHVKDVGRAQQTNYELRMVPAEVGAGTLDWRRLLPAAHAAGARHFYVEQEPPFRIDRWEAARVSHAYLANLAATG